MCSQGTKANRLSCFSLNPAVSAVLCRCYPRQRPPKSFSTPLTLIDGPPSELQRSADPTKCRLGAELGAVGGWKEWSTRVLRAARAPRTVRSCLVRVEGGFCQTELLPRTPLLPSTDEDGLKGHLQDCLRGSRSAGDT